MAALTPAQCEEIACALITTYMGNVCPPAEVAPGSRMPLNVLEMLLSSVVAAVCEASREEEAAVMLQRTWANLAQRIERRDAHLPRPILLGPTVGPMQ